MQQSSRFPSLLEQPRLGTLSVTMAQPGGPCSQIYSGGQLMQYALLPLTVQTTTLQAPGELINYLVGSLDTRISNMMGETGDSSAPMVFAPTDPILGATLGIDPTDTQRLMHSQQ